MITVIKTRRFTNNPGVISAAAAAAFARDATKGATFLFILGREREKIGRKNRTRDGGTEKESTRGRAIYKLKNHGAEIPEPARHLRVFFYDGGSPLRAPNAMRSPSPVSYSTCTLRLMPRQSEIKMYARQIVVKTLASPRSFHRDATAAALQGALLRTSGASSLKRHCFLLLKPYQTSIYARTFSLSASLNNRVREEKTRTKAGNLFYRYFYGLNGGE